MSHEIIWYGPTYDPSGYSSCCREYIYALHNAGVKVKLAPVSFWSPITTSAVSGNEYKLLKEMENTEVSEYAPMTHHVVPDIYRIPNSSKRKHIGYTVFETDGLPPAWVPIMNKCSAIWTPTSFNKATFSVSGIPRERIAVIPHIVRTDKYDPDKVDPIKITIEREFYFLTIMDVTHRKGWDILLRAYLREFKGNRNVALVFKGYYGGVSEQHKKNLMSKLRKFRDELQIKNPPDVIFFGDILDNQDLPKLFKACHCYVSPARGEGWGLNSSDAMAMELPTILTGWSGFTEYANNDNAYLIDVLDYKEIGEEMEKITPNYRHQKWAEPSEAHLRQLMRRVYENYGEAKEKARKGRQDLIQNFSASVIANKIKQELDKL